MAQAPHGEPQPQIGTATPGPKNNMDKMNAIVGAQIPEEFAGKGGPEDKKPRDDKLSPDVVALQKQIIETENRNKRLEKELAELKAALTAPKKDTSVRESNFQPQNLDSAFDTEARVPLTRTIQSALGRTMGKFLNKWTESGPQTRVGLPSEIREKSWLRKLVQI